MEPALTLCGLSLELYLKAIYFHENGKPKNGHDIFKLYNSLSPNSKNSIINFFNTNKESFIKIYENFITHNHIKIISFEETLKELSDIFISMRYMYENLSNQKNLLFRELYKAKFCKQD
ncbi:HEPN domain-containing protein [Epilithonimonas pallida]|uniref:HEPN domain-containing protein n=1 Tax=Epilithonimonas pallida TaxID=373671 RepID=UPI00360A7CEA